jgi:hypothetical protein
MRTYAKTSQASGRSMPALSIFLTVRGPRCKRARLLGAHPRVATRTGLCRRLGMRLGRRNREDEVVVADPASRIPMFATATAV